MEEHGERGLGALALAVGSMRDPRVQAVDATTFIEVEVPEPVAALIPGRQAFHIGMVRREDRAATIAALERGRRLGRATVRLRYEHSPEPLTMTVIDLAEELGVVALVFGDETDPLRDIPSAAAPPVARLVLDDRGVVRRADDSAVALFGDLVIGQASMLELIHEDDAGGAMIEFGHLLSDPDGIARQRVRLLTLQGWRWADIAACHRRTGCGFDLSVSDVHDEVGAVEALRASERRFRTLAESVPIGVFRLDRQGTVLDSNRAFRRITGLKDGASTDSLSVVHCEDRATAASAIASLAEGAEGFDVAVRIRRPSDGAERIVRVLARVRGSSGSVGGVVGSVEDVTERAALEQRLVHEANHDALTGLLGRRAVLREAASRVSGRPPGSEVAVLFLDVNGLKTVNDALGHQAGDDLLVAVGTRLAGLVRPGDLVGRLGGDEFVVVTDLPGGPDGALALAHRLSREASEPVILAGTPTTVRVSIGVAVSRPGDRELGPLLRAADLAMYEAKHGSEGSVRLIDDRIRQLGERRVRLEHDLAGAVRGGELLVEYQPIVDLATRTTCGAEALLRWQHPELGRVSPSEFVPLAEKLGVVHELGHWLVERVLTDLATIRGADRRLAGFVLAVNMSAQQLGAEGMAERLLGTVSRHGFTPGDLAVEITEMLGVERVPLAEHHIERLAAAGVAFSLDDFGTAYSSVDYLTRLPATTLKLDLGFTRRLASSERSRAVTRGLAVLCRELGLRLVAEGVETAELLDLVADLGVTHAQGYLLARPVPLTDLVDLLVGTPDLVAAARAGADATR